MSAEAGGDIDPRAGPRGGPSTVQEAARAPLMVLAVGGNALLPAGSQGRLEDQWRAVRGTAEAVARLAAEGWRLVVTHGNGPQVGVALQRAAIAEPELPPLTMDVAVAHSQGEIGYALARAIADALPPRGLDRPVAALVSQVRVDARDPAFESPSKPIGRFLTRSEAERLAEERGWRFSELAPGPRGWRRVVASPEPLEILELDAIRRLADSGTIVVACGGGGIPVVRQRDLMAGIPAVIDKDLVSSLLALELEAELLLIATAVERVALDYGRPEERRLDRMTAAEAARYLASGQFPAGSMGPKVEAARRFVAGGGRRAIITDLDHLDRAWQGEAGTQVLPDRALEQEEESRWP